MNIKKYFIINNRDIIPISLILILVASRLIPHPPNFTPVITIAIMSGYLFKNIYLSLFVLLVSMLLGDFFIGYYKNMLFVYFSLFLITFIFSNINNKINYKNLLFFGFCGSLIFFIISNLGVWLTGNLYTKNLNGLMECYFLALPFFKNTILSTFLFSYIIYFSNNYLNVFSKENN
tara:strand:- start:14085 stop:14612 length:528 start_codon:yes stop_codon:yes gene_type:complete